MDMNVHNTKKVEISEKLSEDGTTWRVLTITEEDGTETKFTLFECDGGTEISIMED